LWDLFWFVVGPQHEVKLFVFAESWAKSKERPLLGCFLAGLVLQRNKTLKEIGFKAAQQCTALLANNFHTYAKHLDGSELAEGRKKNRTVDPATWHSVTQDCFRDPQQTLEKSLTQHGLSQIVSVYLKAS